MPRTESRLLVWALAAFLGLWIFPGQGQDALANLSYRGLWETNENEGGRLLQLYNHRLSLDLDQDLTERLSSRENINYNYRWEQEGLRRETVSPSASLMTNGDIFYAGLSVNSLRNLGVSSSARDSDTLAIVWASRWEKILVPELRANYDYTRGWGEAGDRIIEDNRQAYGGDVKWNLLLGQAFYSYRHEANTSPNNEMIQDSQLAKINASRKWLDNRLRVYLGHEYGNNRNERRTNFTTASTVNSLANPTGVSVNDIFDDPAPADFDDSMLNPAAYMLNDLNPLLLPAFTATATGNKNNSIVLDNNNGQQWDRVYLYTRVPAPTLGLTWAFYSHDLPNTPWTPLPGVIPPPTYDTTNQRYVIALPALKPTYLKIVVVLEPWVADIDFTEVQAEEILHGRLGGTALLVTEASNNKSNFSLDYKINRTVAVYYSLLLQNDAVDGITKTEREHHSGGLRLQNTAGDLKSNLSMALTNHLRATNPEIQTKSYQLDVNKVFLPTLTAAVGGSHEESSQSGAVLYDRNRFTFYGDARLYPDLNSRLDVTYWEQTNYNSVSGNSDSDSLRSQLTVSSRFSPSLNVSFSDTYEVQNRDQQLSRQSNSISLSANWQVSVRLMLNGLIQKEDSKLAPDAYGYTAGMVVYLGAGLELKGDYSVRDSVYTSQAGSAILRWSSRRNVSWELGCNYAESEAVMVANAYKVYSKVQVNFATR